MAKSWQWACGSRRISTSKTKLSHASAKISRLRRTRKSSTPPANSFFRVSSIPTYTSIFLSWLPLPKIVADSTASFKIFLAYKNFFGIDDAEMYQTLELAQRLGVIVTAHCEDAELVARLQQKLLAEGRTGPEWHEPSRPESVEAEGTSR